MSDWHFEFGAAPGARILRSRFIGIKAGWSDPKIDFDDMMWWDNDNRIWRKSSDVAWGKNNPNRTYALSSSAPCRSFAAFKRHLRKHRSELQGMRVVLVSRFVGCDIIAEVRP